MMEFKVFFDTHGVGSMCESAAPVCVEKYMGVVPNDLVAMWKERGWCAYSDGLIWVVNPDDLDDLVEDWIGKDGLEPVVIARTAFADLFLWGQGGVHFLSVNYGRVTRISNSINDFFDVFLCSQKNINGVLRYDLFREAVDTYGILGHEECYAFVPALALGGDEDVSHIEKVALREYINFLSQVVIE